MHFLRGAIIAFAFLPMTLSAFAEQAAVGSPTPKVPLVARTPANGTWTFSLQSSAPKTTKGKQKPPIPAAAPAVITDIRTTQTGRLRLEEVTFSDKRVVQNWYVEGTLLLTSMSDGKISAAMIEPDWDRTSIMVPTGFAGFTWIKKEYYAGLGDFDKQPAYHYKRTNEAGLELEAWVDTSSNLPIAFRAGPRTYIYSFASEPPAPLTLPEQFLAVEEKLKAELEYHKKLEKELEPGQ